jgi:hypothetical protein
MFCRLVREDEQLEETRFGGHLLLEPVTGFVRHQSIDLRRLLCLQITRLQNRFARLGWIPGK